MFIYKHNQANLQTNTWPKLRLVVRFESIRKFKLKRNDWLLAGTCQQAANHCALF